MHETTGHRIVVSFCPGNKMIKFLARCLLDLRPPNNWGGKIIIMKSLFVGIYILINGNRLLIKTLEKAYAMKVVHGPVPQKSICLLMDFFYFEIMILFDNGKSQQNQPRIG